MRLLVLSDHFPPEVNPNGILMAQLFKHVASDGHEVTVVTSLPHYEQFRIWPEYRRTIHLKETVKGMEVHRLRVWAPGRKTMVNRLLNYLSFNLGATIWGLFTRQRFDLIFATNGSFFTGVTSRIIGWRSRAPFIYNVQDLYPEVPAQAGQLQSRRSISILRSVAAYMYRAAAHITVIAPSFADHIASQGVPREKLSIVPNFVDTAVHRPGISSSGYRDKWHLDGAFTVVYAGNLGYAYDLDTLLEAANKLKSHTDISFVLVGDGVRGVQLREEASRLELENLHLKGFVPYEEMPQVRAVSDIQVCPYAPGAGHFSLPSKLYEIMASGRPLLVSADAGTDVRNLVERTRCGICVTPGDASALANAILELKNDPVMRQELGINGRSEVERSYSTEAVFPRYVELMQAVAAEGNRR